MYFNPALIDEKLPRTAVQILMIRITSDEEHWPGLAEKITRNPTGPRLKRFFGRTGRPVRACERAAWIDAVT
jgi:hypothetical protein